MIYVIFYNQRHEDLNNNVEHGHVFNKNRQFKRTMFSTNGNVGLFV